MIPMSRKAMAEYKKDPYYSVCCHVKLDGHVCIGKIQWEHPWARNGDGTGSMRNIVIPVCSWCNYSPDKKTKAWSKLCAMDKYGIEKLKELSPKKNWIGEKRLCESFFSEDELQKYKNSLAKKENEE